MLIDRCVWSQSETSLLPWVRGRLPSHKVDMLSDSPKAVNDALQRRLLVLSVGNDSYPFRGKCISVVQVNHYTYKIRWRISHSQGGNTKTKATGTKRGIQSPWVGNDHDVWGNRIWGLVRFRCANRYLRAMAQRKGLSEVLMKISLADWYEAPMEWEKQREQ